MHLQNLQFETHATLQDHCLIKDNVQNYNFVSLKTRKGNNFVVYLFLVATDSITLQSLQCPKFDVM
jgi:hypothetical protein